MACPWAHRTIILRELKGLEDAIGMSVVDPIRDEEGWAFRDVPGTTATRCTAGTSCRRPTPPPTRTSTAASPCPCCGTRETEPHRQQRIGRHPGDAQRGFDAFAEHPELDYYPADLRPVIDPLNERVYETVNNGVYRSGFASTQDAYEEAVLPLFDTLDGLDERLRPPLPLRRRADAADWRLFTTLLRFDSVYYPHFKCNLRRDRRLPEPLALPARPLRTPGVAETVDMDQIKRHYYCTHGGINPSAIVPVGPALDFDEPHEREALAA